MSCEHYKGTVKVNSGSGKLHRNSAFNRGSALACTELNPCSAIFDVNQGWTKMFGVETVTRFNSAGFYAPFPLPQHLHSASFGHCISCFKLKLTCRQRTMITTRSKRIEMKSRKSFNGSHKRRDVSFWAHYLPVNEGHRLQVVICQGPGETVTHLIKCTTTHWILIPLISHWIKVMHIESRWYPCNIWQPYVHVS